jgi:hypothetical protein
MKIDLQRGKFLRILGGAASSAARQDLFPCPRAGEIAGVIAVTDAVTAKQSPAVRLFSAGDPLLTEGK